MLLHTTLSGCKILNSKESIVMTMLPYSTIGNLRLSLYLLSGAPLKVECSHSYDIILCLSFEKLYAYTNQPTTGIRHALMDSSGTYVPKAEEALFMLVSCSAFINYLNKKK